MNRMLWVIILYVSVALSLFHFSPGVGWLYCHILPVAHWSSQFMKSGKEILFNVFNRILNCQLDRRVKLEITRTPEFRNELFLTRSAARLFPYNLPLNISQINLAFHSVLGQSVSMEESGASR